MHDISIIITKLARKGLEKAPSYVQDKFFTWVSSVELVGIDEVRKLPGYHDEPLQGKRQGQRSVRLNKKWRVIYEETEIGILITILEVTGHDYRTK